MKRILYSSVCFIVSGNHKLPLAITGNEPPTKGKPFSFKDINAVFCLCIVMPKINNVWMYKEIF